ncbi:WW domain-binding 11 [Gossypium arboreum]|uniref:WW domain-binding 11 n=1 Tax=Gossypium arboreum TaxID=29729 RepID=A0A0B0PML1_GOSAR|nr:WW domain-binding 11 [Gossypium arboreum]KHG25669.1 WW domain-binding 11 [Gossypium arboreum]
MSRTCIGHTMRASVRHVWDMHRPRDVSQYKTCLRYAPATRCVSVRPCLGHGIGTYRGVSIRPCLGHRIGTDM